MIWVIIAVALLIAEATTTAFVAIYFGIAAAIAAVLALIGLPVLVQLIASAASPPGGWC